MYEEATQRPFGTVFQYPIEYTIDVIENFKNKDGNPQDPEMTTNESVFYPTDDANKFTRSIDIPTVLGLDLTDKNSRGVYEQDFKGRDANPIDEPTEPGGSGFYEINQRNLGNDYLTPPPVDATNLNNPATDGLTTVYTQSGSPLGANFAGQSIVASGNDQAGFFNPGSVSPSEFIQSDPTIKPSDCSWYDVPCMFQTIKGEVTILIVGLVILAIGIFAMTR